MGCCDTPGLLPIENALSQMLANTKSIQEIETFSLTAGLNRVLAEDVFSSMNVPPFDNSAMDGYALRYEDLTESTTLICIGKAFAGSVFEGVVTKGTCVRIMTGAKIPEGADTVIMQEQTQVEGEIVKFLSEAKPQQNVRPKGDDIKQGELVLAKGTRLTAREIPLLATLGVDKLRVFSRPKVAFFSTGDELKAVGETLNEGEIYDSNRYTIKAMLEKLHCEPIDMGVVPDDPAQLKLAFTHAAQKGDLVITSGGVSVGEADFTKDILAQEGEVNFWKLAIKPGKPFAFGKIGDALFCGLPGNPVSVLVTLHVLVQPLIEKLSGHSQWKGNTRLIAEAESGFRKSSGRTDYQRAIYYIDQAGNIKVKSTGNQGSGAFSSLSLANCFAVLEQEREHVSAGETVTIELFNAALN